MQVHGKYVKAYVEGYLGQGGDLCLRMSAVCEDSDVTIFDEEMKNDVLAGICKVIFVKAVIPLDTPLKMIKSFADFCRICIFPFLNFVNENQGSES